MNRNHIFTILVLSVLVAVSCGRTAEEPAARPCPYVVQALSDTSSAGYKVLSAYDDADVSGVISVIGPLAGTAVLTEALLRSDRFDNIDGRMRPDSLPDFAGETISAFFDLANAPYHGYFRSMNEDFVREIAAECAVEAVNGRCYANPFDHEGKTEKRKAKAIMFSSSLMSGYGYDDVRMLFEESGKEICVIAPLQSVFGDIFSRHDNVSAVGVWADIETIASGVYGLVSEKEAEKYGAGENFRCVCLSPEFTGNPDADLRTYLDMYAASGHDERLDAVIIDDFTKHAYADSLNAAFSRLLLSDSPESDRYRLSVSGNFGFISPVETMAADCYEYLRGKNRFTHEIAYPAAEGYMTVPVYSPGVQNLDENGFFKDEYKYDRAADSGKRTVKTIPVKERYLPEDAPQIDSIAPLTYKRLFHVHK